MENTYPENDNLLVKDESVLIVIDVQENLIPVQAHAQKVVDNIIRLLKFSQIIDLPVILTEQEKLGSTIPEVKESIPNFSPIRKLVFNSFLCDEFAERLQRLQRKTLILTGVEAHICVAQTAIHALPQFKIYTVSDAVSSRTLDNRTIGLERMKQEGAIITSTEMVVYELLRKAGTDEFKAALKLVK